MKGTFLGVMAVIMLTGGAAFVSAWEGAAAIAPGGDLPGGGYSIATNSFPVNSTVEVTNLENGKRVRVKVISGIGTVGLMATLSRNAADAIGLQGSSSCRIRMNSAPIGVAVSQLALGPIPDAVAAASSSSVLADPAQEDNATAVGVFDAAVPETFASETVEPGDDSSLAAAPVNQSFNGVNDKTPESSDAPFTAAVSPTEGTDRAEAPAVPPPVTTLFWDMETESAGTNTGRTPAPGNPAVITLRPDEARIPQPSTRVITPEYLAPPLGRMEYVPPPDFSPFQAPLISGLQQGKYYVQVAAYARPSNVEDEISRIGKAYPLAVQNIGTDSKPLFRVLLGPLDQSESTVLLQHFKGIGYTDAFVRRN